MFVNADWILLPQWVGPLALCEKMWRINAHQRTHVTFRLCDTMHIEIWLNFQWRNMKLHLCASQSVTRVRKIRLVDPHLHRHCASRDRCRLCVRRTDDWRQRFREQGQMTHRPNKGISHCPLLDNDSPLLPGAGMIGALFQVIFMLKEGYHWEWHGPWGNQWIVTWGSAAVKNATFVFAASQQISQQQHACALHTGSYRNSKIGSPALWKQP